jgi:tetratricopeptide (TPR) repeat protein
MNTIRPRPYPQKGSGNYNAGNEGADKDGHNPSGQERQNQNQQTLATGRADKLQQAQVYSRAEINSPAQIPYPQRQAYPAPTHPMRVSTPIHQVNPQQYQSLQAQAGYQSVSTQSVQPSSSIASSKNNRVNIAQILKDFRNTIKAIATPENIEEEVNKYLLVVEEQVRSPQPQVNIIQSNLKIAASMLDNYISETLNKDSKVVQNWLDALFLQKINYNYNTEEINPNFLVKFPDSTKKSISGGENQKDIELTAESNQDEVVANSEIEVSELELEQENTQNVEEEFVKAEETISQKPNITIIPQDTRLKSLFLEAKKQAFSNNPQKAMSIFKEAFNRAGELNDSETQSRICLEIGKIYDDNDFVAQALNSYHKSLQYTTDTNVKSRAHYSMAQIYDDVNEVGPALEHYLTSISYAGKSDDLVGQSGSLTRVANIFTDKYDEKAFEYYEIAHKLVDQTLDDNMKGYVLSNTADACAQFRKNDKALKYYAEAVKNYEKTNANEEIAQNYKSAAELMIYFNSPNKAKSLLKKAMINAVKTQNEDLISEINMLLATVSQ